MREFAGIGLGVEPAPDETTVCRFRHLLERYKLGKPLWSAVNRRLKTQAFRGKREVIRARPAKALDFTNIR